MNFLLFYIQGDETSVSNSKQEIERIMQLLTNAKEITQEITIQLFGTLQVRLRQYHDIPRESKTRRF